MPTVTINTDASWYASKLDTTYSITDPSTEDSIGYLSVKQGIYRNRTIIRFPLTTLPSGVNVTRVRLKTYCSGAGGAAHLLDTHAYDTNGQTQPAGRTAEQNWVEAGTGNLYVDDSTELRTTGEKWFTLGDGENAQACIDVENAKAAVNRFSLGLHEEGDDDSQALIHDDSYTYPPQLEITYEVPVVWGGSALPQVQMAKAILGL